LQQRKILQVKHYFQKYNIFIRRVGEEEEKKRENETQIQTNEGQSMEQLYFNLTKIEILYFFIFFGRF